MWTRLLAMNLLDKNQVVAVNQGSTIAQIILLAWCFRLIPA